MTEQRPQAPTLPKRADAAAVLDRTVARAAPANTAGQVLAFASVVPTLLATAWLLAAFPLAALGEFRAWLVVPLAVVVAAVLVPYGVGVLRRPTARLAAPWWATAATFAIAVAFTVFVAATHSQQAVLRRDAGSYAQIGLWLSQHGALSAPIPSGAFGSAWTELAFASPGFYTQGDSIVPQFMTGWPTMLAAANWVAGWPGMFLLPAFVGGALVLALGGLAARLIGARWAPLAALLVALAWPVMRVSQQTYSEPLAALVLAGGLCLLVDALRLVREKATSVGSANDAGAQAVVRRRLGAAGFVLGLVLAGGELVRLDMGVDVGLLVPVIGWWFLTRQPGARAFVGGAALGGALGLIDSVFVTLPYVRTNWESVSWMLVGLVLVVAATAFAVVRLRAWGRSPLDLAWWPRLAPAGAVVVLVTAAALLIRPYVMEDHSSTNLGVIAYTAEMQGWLGLPIDGTRGYTEQTVWWIAWYLGWPLLAAALIAATALTFRVLRAKDTVWVPVLLAYGASAVLTLFRPGITPDHPWADRRMVVEVIPAMILFATWTVAAATRLTRSAATRSSTVASADSSPDGSSSAGSSSASASAAGLAAVGRWRGGLAAAVGRTGALIPAGVAVIAVAAFVVPMATVTAHLGPTRTDLGEVAASATVCRSLRPDDSVVLLDPLWAPTIRTECRVPVAQLTDFTSAGIDRVTASIRDVGRTPVFATGRADLLAHMPTEPVEVVTLHTQQDQHQLVQRPTGTDPLTLEFWLTRP